MTPIFFIGSLASLAGLLYWIVRAQKTPGEINPHLRRLSSGTTNMLDLLEAEMRPSIESNKRENLPFHDMLSLYLNSRAHVDSAHGMNLYDPTGEQGQWLNAVEQKHARLRGELFLALLESCASLAFGTRSPLHSQAVLTCYADEMWMMNEMACRRSELIDVSGGKR